MRFAVLAALALAACSNAQQPSADAPGADAERLHAQVDSLLAASIADRAFPGASAAAGYADRVAMLTAQGTYTYDDAREVTPQTRYDLASLTKVVATTTAAMLLVERGELDLEAPAARYVPAFGQAGKEDVTVRQLMTHSAGLTAFRPFHVQGFTTAEQVFDTIYATPVQYEPGTRSVYSDWGMMVMLRVVEEITGEPFEQWVEANVFRPLGMDRTGFVDVDAPDAEAVPTEIDGTRGLVSGYVHDETAMLVGGVAGHAGLFSTAEDLSRFARMVVGGGEVDGVRLLRPETIAQFTTVEGSVEGSTRALGWDTRSPEGYSSAGTRMGPRAFGHTGFTGTSMWFDPDAGLFAILLTNRVHPTRENSKIGGVRAAYGDLVYDALAP
jgi:CubicO group peptidase (beta-lactamase class C family)